MSRMSKRSRMMPARMARRMIHHGIVVSTSPALSTTAVLTYT